MLRLCLRSGRRRVLLRRRNDDAVAAVDVRPRDRAVASWCARIAGLCKPSGSDWRTNIKKPSGCSTEQRALIAELEQIQASKSTATRASVRQPPIAEFADSRSCGSLRSEIRRSAPARVPARLPDLPERLVDHYREMLRAYVVMGAGNLADEMTALATPARRGRHLGPAQRCSCTSKCSKN